MPTIRSIRMLASEVLEVEWIRQVQTPGVTPPEWEQESVVERYTPPPGEAWKARARRQEIQPLAGSFSLDTREEPLASSLDTRKETP